MKKYFLSAILGLIFYQISFANEENFKLEASSLSASGLDFSASAKAEENLEISKEQPGKVLSVINKAEVENHVGSGGIHSLLENVPGVVLSRGSSVGGQMVVRGMSSYNGRSSLAIDGVKARGRSALEFNMIDPGAIEKIEILRSADSVKYGSNAQNGVINFISRRYTGDIFKPFEMQTKIRSMEFATNNKLAGTRLEALGGGDGWDVLFGLHTRRASNYRTPEGEMQNTHFWTIGGDLNAGYNFDDYRFYLQAKAQRNETYNAGGQPFVYPGISYGGYRNENPMQEYYLRAGIEGEPGWIFADKFEDFIYWRRYYTDLFIHQLGGAQGGYYHQKVYNNNQLGWHLNFTKTFGAHELSYGLDSTFLISPTQVKRKFTQTGREIATSRDSYQQQWGFFLKDDFKINEKLLLSAALRYDYLKTKMGTKRASSETPEISSKINANREREYNAFSGHLGAIYSINDNFSLFASFNRGFNSPGTEGYPSAGNLANFDLKPEISLGFEAGAKFANDFSFLSLNFYQVDYKNMIQSVANADGLGNSQTQNVGRAQVKGIELESSFDIGLFNFSANAAYTHGQDKSANKPLAYIAPFVARANLSYEFEKFTLRWTQRFYQGKNRIDASKERKSKSYTMSDLTMIFELEKFEHKFKDTELVLGVSNLFNQKGRNPTTYDDIRYPIALSNPIMEPGINFFMKINWKY